MAWSYKLHSTSRAGKSGTEAVAVPPFLANLCTRLIEPEKCADNPQMYGNFIQVSQ